MFLAILSLINPGDEVILFEPLYGYHVSTLVATASLDANVYKSARNIPRVSVSPVSDFLPQWWVLLTQFWIMPSNMRKSV